MIINSLKPNRDSYGIDEINCFEKPVGIVLDGYDQKLSGVFYMFIKCCNTYQLEPPEYCSNINNFDTMILAETIINNNFNLHFQRVIPHDDLHSFIEDNIKKYNRVLVPINLKELYYAHEYKSIDWPHLLVIKGFDHDKKLYNILDYTQQNYDDAIYTPFVMEYDTLLRTYRSYCDTFNSKNITVISNIQNETPSSIPDIIEQCLSLFDSKLSSNPHFLFNTMELILEIIETQEKDEIKKSMKQDKIGSFKFSVICRFMANEVKGKNVFFTELINNSREILGNIDLLMKIDENKKILLDKWDTLINRVIHDMMRVKPFDYTDEMNELIAIESYMKELLSDLHKRFKEFNLKNKYKPSSFMDCFYYENNEDDIITVEETRAAFHFTNDKQYDCWLGDHAPKLLLDLPNIGVKEFSISTEVNITNVPVKAGYLSGIVVRTANNSVLYYGLHSDQEIKIDEKLRNFCVKKMPYPHSSVKLQVVFKDGKCTFYYSTDSNDSMERFYEFEPDGMICEVGLSCKSWEKSKGLDIEFKNVSFEKII